MLPHVFLLLYSLTLNIYQCLALPFRHCRALPFRHCRALPFRHCRALPFRHCRALPFRQYNAKVRLQLTCVIIEESSNKPLGRWLIITSLGISRYFKNFINSNILNFKTPWFVSSYVQSRSLIWVRQRSLSIFLVQLRENVTSVSRDTACNS